MRNLPLAITEKQVEKFFRPHLAKFSINTFHCKAFKGKASITCSAAITIADARKARDFLQAHGQAGHGKEHFDKVKQKLFYMRKPVYCTEGTQPPDRFLISSLQRDEIEKLHAKSRSSKPSTTSLRRRFGIKTLYCGQWDYVKEQLVFMSHYEDQRTGVMMFGRQSIIIILHPARSTEPAQRVEISYFDIESFTIGSSSNPTATFALCAPPKLYEELQAEDSLVEKMRSLSVGNKPMGFKRKRIMALRKGHELIVSSCLGYQVMMEKSSDISLLQALKRAQEIPENRILNTYNIPKHDFSTQWSRLNTALSRQDPPTVSFEVKFQLQRLAQNGILPPAKVVELLNSVNHNFRNINDTTLVAAIQKLYFVIPYAGPQTEASEFSIRTLSTLLAEHVKSAALEASYSHLAETYEHIALVHKATVTPVGIILSGPEPEVINRVIRKFVHFAILDSVNYLLICGKQVPEVFQLFSSSLVFRRELGINSISTRYLQ